MKKIATLILAAGLVFGMSTGAQAVDFKAKGEWIMSFDYGQNGGFTGGSGRTGYDGKRDEFEAYQRLRFQIDAVASEALSGQVFFEIGNQVWGEGSDKATGGGALGADGTNSIKVRRAFIDWLVPQTDLKVRMGLQGMALPSFTTESQVFNDDVAGITLSYKFTDNVALTAFWARPYNDNYGDEQEYYVDGVRHTYKAKHPGFMDNMDAFGLVLPLTFDGVKVTPWAMYAAIGPNTFRGINSNGELRYFEHGVGVSYANALGGLLPANGARHKDGSSARKSMGSYGSAFWAGLTGEVTAFDPFRIAWDINFGSVSWPDNSRLNRAGWLASLLFEYKLDWGIPGIYGWYGSGDNDDAGDGSERMPYLSTGNTNNGFSNFAFNGHPYTSMREGALGRSMAGTWGVGARLKDVSFLEDLKHTLYLNVMGGTNSTTMKRVFHRNDVNYGPNMNTVGMDPLYMTTNDTAMEIGLTTTYKVYENFLVYLDAAYIATWLDQSNSVWGHRVMNGAKSEVRDPWNVNLSFVYSF